MRLSVDQILVYRVTISHNSRFRTGTELCNLGQPLVQAHLPLQPFLHPHRSSSLDDTAASGRVVHTGFQFDGSVQPQFSGDGIWGAASVALTMLPQLCPH